MLDTKWPKRVESHTAQCQIDILWGGGPQTDARVPSLVLCAFFHYLLIMIVAAVRKLLRGDGLGGDMKSEYTFGIAKRSLAVRFAVTAVVVMAALFLFSPVSHAQITGTITGTVADSSGAIVPGA